MLIPLLIVGDSPNAPTGLGRIARDLASLVATNLNATFRVATLGYGGTFTRTLPFAQYSIASIDDWQIPELQEVWEDFAGTERGIVLTIWDVSRLRWLLDPRLCRVPGMLPFLTPPARPFDLWGYIPIDSYGPNKRLTHSCALALKGFDRILAYSEFGSRVLSDSLGYSLRNGDEYHIPYLPHGINTDVFKPRDTMQAKKMFGHYVMNRNQPIKDDVKLIGVVATNQPRKDWGLAFSVVHWLKQEDVNVGMWIHTDELYRYWDLRALANDFGLQDRIIATTGVLNDHQMSWAYSACDLTLGIGLGEGFGYPIFESLACGTPVIHGAYGGAASFLDPPMLVDPVGYRYEGVWNSVRPVYSARDWYEHAALALDERYDSSLLPTSLAWKTLGPEWIKWFQKGANQFHGTEKKAVNRGWLNVDILQRAIDRAIEQDAVNNPPAPNPYLTPLARNSDIATHADGTEGHEE